MKSIREELQAAAPFSPMGWNSWDCFGASVTEAELLENAEYMAQHLKKYGWEYVVCDIQWYEPEADSAGYHKFTRLCMDEYSRLLPAVNRFPSAADGKGFKPIADRIHELGLKFGLHMMRGIPRQAVHENGKILGTEATARQIAHPASLCSWNTDMYGIDTTQEGAQAYYDSVFALYASWGVDYVKVDDLGHTYYTPEAPRCAARELEMIHRAIQNSGRTMVLSVSPGPAQLSDGAVLQQNANLWRMTDDLWDDWNDVKAMFERCQEWQDYVGDGSWPDCDMLPLGHIAIRSNARGLGDRYTRLTQDEQKTMMTLWGMFRSPLMFGGNLKDNDDFTNSLLTNSGILKMHRDGRNAREIYREEDVVIWKSTTEDEKTVFLAIFNLNDKAKSVRLLPNVLQLQDTRNLPAFYAGLEIWTSETVSVPGLARIAAPVVHIPAHGVVCCRFQLDE